MDKSTERETHDFMSVESFSQLPFIRPAPPAKEKGGAIRLFGKEFGANTTIDDDHLINRKDNNAKQEGEANNDSDNSRDINNNNRKFECHYCCRNFPTSQALGGHQNAHKRERQHAKRAHLQSAMAHGGLSDAHDNYGLMTYSRIGSAPTLPISYHSWNSSITSSTPFSANASLYGSYGGSYNSYHQTQPINGSPLALWKIPASAHSSSSGFTRERDLTAQINPQIPLFGLKDDNLKPLSGIRSGGLNSQGQLGYESKTSMQDHHVSLDLHL